MKCLVSPALHYASEPAIDIKKEKDLKEPFDRFANMLIKVKDSTDVVFNNQNNELIITTGYFEEDKRYSFVMHFFGYTGKEKNMVIRKYNEVLSKRFPDAAILNLPKSKERKCTIL